MYIRPLDIEGGKNIYDELKLGHTFVVINNSVVIESNLVERNHNKVTITPLKEYKFPEQYFRGVIAPIPKDMSINDIINKIKMDKGEYKPTTNSCYHTVKEILTIIKADKKIIINK